MCTPPPANQRRSPSPSPRMIVPAVLIPSSFRVRCLSSATVDPGPESGYDRFLSYLPSESGRSGKITHLSDEQGCYLRHNCTQDVVRRYDGRRRSGGADFLRSEEALLRGAARRASAPGRGDRTFAARGAVRGVLRLDEGSGEWLYHARPS